MNINVTKLADKNYVKELMENDIILTSEEVKSLVKEHNKTAGFFGKRNARGTAHVYKKLLKSIENETKKIVDKKAEQMNEFCKLAGISVEEYMELSTFERAQLNLQMQQIKDMDQTKNMVALNTIANGLDRL